MFCYQLPNGPRTCLKATLQDTLSGVMRNFFFFLKNSFSETLLAHHIRVLWWKCVVNATRLWRTENQQRLLDPHYLELDGGLKPPTPS